MRCIICKNSDTNTTTMMHKDAIREANEYTHEIRDEIKSIKQNVETIEKISSLIKTLYIE